MQSIVRRACNLATGAIMLTVLALAFLAYFVSSQPTRGVMLDGLGRQLVPAPLGVQMFLGTDPVWPGWIWALADSAITMAAVALCFGLQSFANRRAKRSPAAGVCPPAASPS